MYESRDLGPGSWPRGRRADKEIESAQFFLREEVGSEAQKSAENPSIFMSRFDIPVGRVRGSLFFSWKSD